MLERVREALLMSAAARNLAIDLVDKHGCGALDVIENKRRDAKPGSNRAKIADIAHDYIMELIRLLPDG